MNDFKLSGSSGNKRNDSDEDTGKINLEEELENITKQKLSSKENKMKIADTEDNSQPLKCPTSPKKGMTLKIKKKDALAVIDNLDSIDVSRTEDFNNSLLQQVSNSFLDQSGIDFEQKILRDYKVKDPILEEPENPDKPEKTGGWFPKSPKRTLANRMKQKDNDLMLGDLNENLLKDEQDVKPKVEKQVKISNTVETSKDNSVDHVRDRSKTTFLIPQGKSLLEVPSSPKKKISTKMKIRTDIKADEMNLNDCLIDGGLGGGLGGGLDSTNFTLEKDGNPKSALSKSSSKNNSPSERKVSILATNNTTSYLKPDRISPIKEGNENRESDKPPIIPQSPKRGMSMRIKQKDIDMAFGLGNLNENIFKENDDIKGVSHKEKEKESSPPIIPQSPKRGMSMRIKQKDHEMAFGLGNLNDNIFKEEKEKDQDGFISKSSSNASSLFKNSQEKPPAKSVGEALVIPSSPKKGIKEKLKRMDSQMVDIDNEKENSLNNKRYSLFVGSNNSLNNILIDPKDSKQQLSQFSKERNDSKEKQNNFQNQKSNPLPATTNNSLNNINTKLLNSYVPPPSPKRNNSLRIKVNDTKAGLTTNTMANTSSKVENKFRFSLDPNSENFDLSNPTNLASLANFAKSESKKDVNDSKNFKLNNYGSDSEVSASPKSKSSHTSNSKDNNDDDNKLVTKKETLDDFFLPQQETDREKEQKKEVQIKLKPQNQTEEKENHVLTPRETNHIREVGSDLRKAEEKHVEPEKSSTKSNAIAKETNKSPETKETKKSPETKETKKSPQISPQNSGREREFNNNSNLSFKDLNRFNQENSNNIFSLFSNYYLTNKFHFTELYIYYYNFMCDDKIDKDLFVLASTNLFSLLKKKTTFVDKNKSVLSDIFNILDKVN